MNRVAIGYLKPKPSQIFLRECFDYRDGELFWRVRPYTHFKSVGKANNWNSQMSGKRAGCFNKHEGRWFLSINRNFYKVHNLVWVYHRGYWPDCVVDHADKDCANNRIENLREATRSQNQANRPKQANNTSGYKGVYWSKQNKGWVARINFKKKSYWLGCFKTPEEASAAYVEAAPRIHGEFARHE